MFICETIKRLSQCSTKTFFLSEMIKRFGGEKYRASCNLSKNQDQFFWFSWSIIENAIGKIPFIGSFPTAEKTGPYTCYVDVKFPRLLQPTILKWISFSLKWYEKVIEMKISTFLNLMYQDVFQILTYLNTILKLHVIFHLILESHF